LRSLRSVLGAVLGAVLVFALCLPVCATAAAAQNSASEELVRQHIDIDLKQNGSYLMVSDTALRALNTQGLAHLQKISMSYTAFYQSLAITDAYTLKADGRRVQVDPKAGVLYGHGATSLPGYADVKTITVLFPDLEVGDQTVLKTTFQQLKPWFPGQFDFTYNAPLFNTAEDVRISLSAPAALTEASSGHKLWAGSAGSVGSRHFESAGYTLQSWVFKNTEARKFEPGAVIDPDTRPHVAFSTFSGNRAIAKTYAGLLEGKSAVTPEIQALADQLTHGVRGQREQAQALYDFVATRISYVAIVLGAGGFIPHAASEVLANKYGDCKDHVMLLEALLKAKGIESTPVLISVGDGYKLPLIPSPATFNHLITYIPAFDLFADSTTQTTPFGELPDSDIGKPVVLVHSGDEKTTPVDAPSANTIAVTQEIRVGDDGTAKGTTVVTANGQFAAALRGMLKVLTKDSEADYFRERLGSGASGSFDRPGDGRESGPTAFTVRYTIPNYINPGSPGALPADLGYKPFSFTGLLDADLDRRTEPYLCQTYSARNEVTVELPDGAEILATPREIDETANGARLKSTMRKVGRNRLHEVTTLTAAHKSVVCAAEDYNASVGAMLRMISGLKAQALYK